ncbi:glucose dehydrogenase [FAD, quinone]-like [Spodoptera litura]|uniref:Glucose dehydrogenase [FAD, quinone]-like n=1 Tax=Spodoptera litura TaxID=69820 RepID=A0A9J7EHZ1_SPOLT|nr:glucose dehydrogenase [FAD, quinone]-like [Spodoptera litura]
MSSGVTSMQIDQILDIQGAFRTLALLNMVGYLFSEDAPVSDDDIFDYIVVGGGTAGCVVAGRLVDANFKTLVIEAGNNPGEENYAPGLLTYIKNSRMDWNFTTPRDGFTDQCHKGSGIFFGKVLGGTGNTDYMLYGRGNPQDYRSFNEDSWNWKNMLKYFIKSEKLEDNEILNSRYRRYHGTKGRIGVIKENRPETQEYLQAYKEAGKNVVADVIGAGIIGYSGALYHIANGSRTETATAYLSPLKDNPNLYLTRNSTAVKIIFDENKRAVGVQFVKDGKSITVRARKEVIVTTGAVKTPQLLMLSGIGPKQRLEKLNINVISNIPVGKKLQDCVGVLLGFETNVTAKNEPFDDNNYPAQLITGYSALRNCSCDPDYQIINYIIDDTTYLPQLCGFSLGFQNSICDRIYSKDTQIFLSIILHLNVRSYGEVTLRNTDPFAMPNIFPNSYTNDSDLNDIVDYIIDYYKLIETPKFQSMGLKFIEATGKCGRFQFGSRQFWRCYALCMIVPPGRYVGTCSMGSVVDSRLNVIGVRGLRVVDASVIPGTIGSALFGPTVALAEKGVEMIIEDSS